MWKCYAESSVTAINRHESEGLLAIKERDAVRGGPALPRSMDLRTGSSYDALVNVASEQVAFDRVTPLDSGSP